MDKSNLIVNYLPTGFVEDDLRSLFSKFGPIQSIKIVRDKSTGISMGFGFVNFETNDTALSAMNAMNGAQLPQGKVMKISLARPAWKANIHSNVYVSGLPSEFSEEDIMDLFKDYEAQIENVRKLRDSRGVFRGIAVIRFDSEEFAQEAMKRLHGRVLPNASSPLQVRPWRPEFRPERIDSSFTSSSSAKSLSPSPSPSYASLATPSPSGYSKLAALSPPPAPRMEGWQEIWSRYVESQMKQNFLAVPVPAYYMQQPQAQKSPSTLPSPTAGAPSLFVFHLPPDATESTLRVLFEPYGALASVRVLPGKGYGFVNFESVQAAITAIHGLNGFKLGNKHLKVEFKKPAANTGAPVLPTTPAPVLPTTA